jgi:hypothetical protein
MVVSRTKTQSVALRKPASAPLTLVTNWTADLKK